MLKLDKLLWQHLSTQKKNETTVINRLFTQEDKIGPVSHIHKILGILVLLHFIFRYCKIGYSKINGEIDWNGGFDTSFYTLLFILLHTYEFKHIHPCLYTYTNA